MYAATKEECELDNPKTDDDPTAVSPSMGAPLSTPTDGGFPVAATFSPPVDASAPFAAMVPVAPGPFTNESGAGSSESGTGEIMLPGALGGIAAASSEPSPGGSSTSSTTEGNTITDRLVESQADATVTSATQSTREAVCDFTTSALAAVIVSAVFAVIHL